ncbi:hypothetical protein AAD001_02495 [Colwelliaceae bacterium 6471]
MKKLTTMPRKLLLSSLLLGSAFNASAANDTEAMGGFKLAIIEDAIGSDEISSGNYRQALSTLASSTSDKLSSYDRSMGECVAYLKINQYEQSDKACSKAIKLISRMKNKGEHAQYLASISYSNRAVSRYFANQDSAAIDDLTKAIAIHENKIVSDNLAHIQTKTLLTKADDANKPFYESE